MEFIVIDSPDWIPCISINEANPKNEQKMKSLFQSLLSLASGGFRLNLTLISVIFCLNIDAASGVMACLRREFSGLSAYWQ